MSKMTIEQATHQSNKKTADYFTLKNDGDSAHIRFMYRNLSEIETYAVHQIEVNGKRYTVDCLKDAEGRGDCPLCASGNKRRIITYFKVNNEDLKIPQIWTRGIKSAALIENGLKMSRSQEICNDVWKITRRGAPGDINTQYPLEFVKYDNTSYTSLPMAINLDESNTRFIIKASVEELQEYLKTGTLPNIIENTSEEKPTTEPLQRRAPNKF